MVDRNVGGPDRVLRLILGIVLLPLGPFAFDGIDGAIVGSVLGAVGMIGLITGLTGSCLFYAPFHFSTARPSPPWVVVGRLGGGGIRAELRHGEVGSIDRRRSSHGRRYVPRGDRRAMARGGVTQRRLAA